MVRKKKERRFAERIGEVVPVEREEALKLCGA